MTRPCNVVTNPTFNLAEKFIDKAVACARNKVCMLLRLAFLESIERHDHLFSKYPPSRVWVFSERITMYPGGDPNAKTTGGTTAYAWFVWDKQDTSGLTQLCWIPPGHKPQRVRKSKRKVALPAYETISMFSEVAA
jgi:hypothetical protein